MMQRLKDMPANRIIVVAIVIGGAFLGAWVVGAIIIAWFYAFATGNSFDLWSALDAMSSAATLASIIGGGVMALLQLVEAADNRKSEIESRNMALYSDVFERMMSDDQIDARRWIYINLDPASKGMEAIPSEGQTYVKRVLNSMDHLGFILKNDWVTGEEIIQWVSPMIVKLWAKIGPYVDYEAERRHEPDYYEAARELAIRCARWRRDNGYDDGSAVVWLKDAL